MTTDFTIMYNKNYGYDLDLQLNLNLLRSEHCPIFNFYNYYEIRVFCMLLSLWNLLICKRWKKYNSLLSIIHRDYWYVLLKYKNIVEKVATDCVHEFSYWSDYRIHLSYSWSFFFFKRPSPLCDTEIKVWHNS